MRASVSAFDSFTPEHSHREQLLGDTERPHSVVLAAP